MNRWLGSFAGRAFAGLASLLIVTQILSSVLIVKFAVEPQTKRVALVLGETLRALQVSIDSQPPAPRAETIAGLERSGYLAIAPGADRPAGFGLPTSYLEQRFVRTLATRLNDRRGFDWKIDSRDRLWVRLALGGKPYWVSTTGARSTSPWSAIIIASCVSVLAALAAAAALSGRFGGALSRLTLATGRIAVGDTPPALSMRGPEELRLMARSFNRMNDSLQEMDRERAIMLAGVSHDLRTPLTKLRLALELSGEGRDRDLQATAIRQIDEIDRLLGQFLAYARIADQEPRTDVDLRWVVREAVAPYDLVGARPAAVPREPARAPIQAEAMRRALINLLENASRHGRAPIETKLERRGDWLVVSVEDRGDGVGAAEIELLSRPFARGERGASHGAGAGLGLAIAERVARAHEGRLTLENRAGGGFSARIWLPTT